jgi:diaminopimelate epimerase
MTIKYELYSGAGNDFVMIDNITEGITLDKQKELTIKLCNENFPGIDGVIFADKPVMPGSSLRMNYYNRDGSFGAMCGNGARCISMFAHKHGMITERLFNIEAVNDIYSVEITDKDNVKIGFPGPKEVRSDLLIDTELNGEAKPLHVSFVNVGSDHIVLFIDEEINKIALSCRHMDELDVDSIGRALRFNKEFQPNGGNVNFAEILPGGKLRLRTYERGVERETLACGTGIVSTGIIAILKKGFTSPVNVQVQSGETLKVECRIEAGQIMDLSLTGSAKKIGEGELSFT